MKITKRIALAAGLLLLAAPPVQAQRAVALEVGIFAQYSKFSDTTRLEDGFGGGMRFGMYPFHNFALEYEADVTGTKSARVGNLRAFNQRVDAIFYFPMDDHWKLLAGGGWTASAYHTDTTKNQYDSGGNAVIGLKYCVNQNWAWRSDVNVDFKDPSDQTPDGARTTTLNFRLGFSHFLGGPAKNSPCYIAPPKPAAPAPMPAPVVTPLLAPQPAPQPAPVVTPPPPAPPVVQPVPQPAPAPPPPRRRELLSLTGNVFEFDHSNLTAGAKDTLQRAVALLKDHMDAYVEIMGHTDSKGSDTYNQALSERRTISVKNYLVSQGIAANRITTQGFGETQPAATNDTAAGRAINRRVVIIEIRQQP